MSFLILVLLLGEFLGAFGIFTTTNVWIGVVFIVIALCAYVFYKKRKISLANFLPYTPWVLIGAVILFFRSQTPIAEIDSIAYHLPIISNLIKTGNLWDVFNAGFVGPNTYFPAANEVLQAVLIVMTGSTIFGFLVSLAALILFQEALTGLAKSKKGIYIFFVVSAVASIPFLFQQFLHYQIDLFLFAMFGTSAAFLLSSILHNNLKTLAKCLLALGIAVGSKYNGLAQAVLLLPILLIAFWQFRKNWRSIVLYVFLTVIIGGFFYFRNFILTRNSIYPFGLTTPFFNFEGHKTFLDPMAGSSLFHSIYEGGIKHMARSIINNHAFSYSVGKITLLYIPFILFVFTTAFVKLWRKTKTQKLILFILLYLLAGEVTAYALSPYTFTLWDETVRYSSAVFAIIPIIFVYASSQSRFLKYSILVFAIVMLGYNLLFNSFLSDNLEYKLIRHQISQDDFLSERLPVYKEILPAIEVLRAEKPNGFKIALVGLTPYWLFEKEGFTPIYVNIDGCTQCKYPDYRSDEKSIRAYPDEQKWIEAMKSLNIKYLITDNSYNLRLYEAEWADRNGELFKNMVKTDRVNLYKVTVKQ